MATAFYRSDRSRDSPYMLWSNLRLSVFAFISHLLFLSGGQGLLHEVIVPVVGELRRPDAGAARKAKGATRAGPTP